MNEWNGKERRAIILDAETKEMITEMHTLLTDKDMGLCPRFKKLDETINGNGRMGLKSQILILWVLIAILGADSQIVEKVSKWIR